MPASWRWWPAALVAGRIVVALVSAVALVAVGVAWFTVGKFKASTNITPVLSEVGSAPGQPATDDGATDILLVGDDSRTDAQGAALPASVLRDLLRTQYDSGVNTDTIIVLRIPHNGGKAYAVSIPRDSYVPIPGIGTNKINAAYGVTQARTGSKVAGQKALIETVQDLTGVRIDHFVEINLYGFYLLSNAIGGVQVCLRQSTSDPNSGADFRAGVQTISGSNALSFVRQRENLPGGDIDRIVRQQVFLAAAAHKVLSAGTLTSPHALGALMDAMKKTLVTDPGLDLTTLLQQAQGIISGDVEFTTIPIVNQNARSASGQSIVQVDTAQVRQFMAALITPPPTTTVPAPAHVRPPSPSTTSAPPPPTVTAKAPTPPVSVDGVRCVD